MFPGDQGPQNDGSATPKQLVLLRTEERQSAVLSLPPAVSHPTSSAQMFPQILVIGPTVGLTRSSDSQCLQSHLFI